MDSSLVSLLENIGLTNKEARVYLALLELGKGDVTDIARVAELKRSIIYVVLEGLIKRSYVTEVPNQTINTYQAIDPSMILGELQTSTRQFREMLPILRTLSSKGKNRPKIEYHETKKGIWQVYSEMFQAQEVFVITSLVRIEKHFPGSVKNLVRDYKKGLFCLKGQHLVADNKEEIALAKILCQAGQEVRKLKLIDGLNMDFVIYNYKLAITSLEDEPFLVLIESEELVKSMLPIFQVAWQEGEEVK